MQKIIEILAPAGNIDSVYAAVNSGANAIYLGCKSFNARQNAQNFSENELIEIVKYCHCRDVLVYLTLNTLVFDEQLNELIETVNIAKKANIDAFIIQDLAVLKICKYYANNITCHASTQMTIHSVSGAKIAKDLGFKRIVLARELSIEKIKNIIDNVDIEVEVFVHGALCMSISGQCYMSSIIGGNSGNRGRCAGTCRMPFAIDTTIKSNNKINTNGDIYDLSLKDLCSFDIVDKLIEIGVKSLKIEGRMKRPEYCAATVNAYHNAVLNNIKAEDVNNLNAIFSRNGFTNGYLLDNIDKNMFGVRNIEDVSAVTNKLLKSIQNSYKKEPKNIAVSFNVTIDDKKITVTATDADNNYVIKKDAVVATSMIAVSEEKIIDCFKKLGDTYFYLENIDITHDKNYNVSVSVLNKLRRELLKDLSSIRENKIIKFDDNIVPLDVKVKPVKKITNDLNMRVRFRKFKQLTDLAQNHLKDIEYIILPIDEVCKNMDRIIANKNYIGKIIVELDRFITATDASVTDKLLILFNHGFDKLMASNIAHIDIAKSTGYRIFGDCFLNIINSIAVNEYEKLGLNDITLSFEANINKAKKINSSTINKIGLIAYGYIPLMITANCPIKNEISCKNCEQNKVLVDGTKANFYCICNNKKYSEILNGTPIYLANKLDEFREFDFITLYFTIEKDDEINDILYKYKNNVKQDDGFTNGLYFRKLN